MKNINKQLFNINDNDIKKIYSKLIQEVYNNPDVYDFIKRKNLNKREISNNLSKFYEFISKKKDMLDGKKTYAPDYEPYLILKNNQVEVVYKMTQAAMKKKSKLKHSQLVESIRLPKQLIKANVNDIYSKGKEKALRAALSFIDKCIHYNSTGAFPKGLYLYGSFGVGKTYLLAAMANKLAENNIKSLLIHFPSFCNNMISSIDNNSIIDKLNYLNNIPILILDDIGSNRINSWLRDDILGSILEYRMQNEMPMLFSSNLSMNELQTQYLTFDNKGSSSPLKAMRLMDRIKFLSKEYKILGPNLRNPN